MLIIMGVIAAIIFILTLLVEQNYLFIGIGVILVVSHHVRKKKTQTNWTAYSRRAVGLQCNRQC